MDIRGTFQRERKDIGYLILAFAIFISSRFFPISVFLYVIPLMIVLENKTNKKKLIFLGIFFVYLLISYTTSILSIDSEQRSIMLGVNLVAIKIPLSMLIATTVWVFLDTKPLKVRFISSVIGPAIILLLFMMYLLGDSEGATTLKALVTSVIDQTIKAIVGPEVSEIEISRLNSIMVKGIANTTLMIVTIAIGLTEYLALYFKNKNNVQWQLSTAQWDLSFNYTYVLLGLWSMALAALVFTLPSALEIVIINIALAYSVLYTVKGISLMAFLSTRRNPLAKPSRSFFLMGIFMFLPPANAVIALILTLLGAADTWLTIRKRKKE